MLISEHYRAEQAALHAKGNYGTAALHYGETVAALLNGSGARSLLDYGCGSKRSLLTALKLPDDVIYEGYDPAIPEYAASPCPAELVTCIDVLEHIEPSLLPNVLDDLASLCDPYGFFTIHTGPAVKTLSDGRNAHLTQEGQDWWLPRLKERFEVLELEGIPSGFAVVVRSLKSEGSLPMPGKLRIPKAKSSGAAAAKGSTEAWGPASQAALVQDGVRMLFNTPNEMTAWRVRSLYQKEPDTIRWIASMPKGSVLIDVGANVGMYSVLAAMTRDAVVYAFEPESQNYALLNANISANQIAHRVTAYPLALSDRMQLDKLYLSSLAIGGSCHSFAEEVGFDLKPRPASFAQGSLSMPLDQLVSSGAIPTPDYIKLDVDGFEHKVLEGARQTLSNPKVRGLIVELNTHLPEHRSAMEMLKGLGFHYDEAQATSALRKSGAFEGVGEFIFTRTPPGEAVVDFKRSYTVVPPFRSRGRSVLQHVLERVALAEVVEDPFPYLVVDEVFPADYYAEMLAQFPSTDSLRPLDETGRVSRGAYRERLAVLFSDQEFARMTGPQQHFWRELASWMYTEQFIHFFLFKFHKYLEPRIATMVSSDGSISMKGDALLVNDQTNYAISPHTDADHRLVSFLFYLPRDTRMRELGTSVYRARDPSFVCWGGQHHPLDRFERVSTVDFLPNRLMAFPKTDRSFHGVERIGQANVDRPLLINNIRLLNKVTH